MFCPGESYGLCRLWDHKESYISFHTIGKVYKAPPKLMRGALSAPSWCLCQKLSLSLFYWNKTFATKSSEWLKLCLWSQSKILSFEDQESNTIHHKLSINFYCVCACVLNHFSQVQLFATLWTVASQAPLSMGFPRQEYWSELLCPPPRDLPDSRIETASLRSPALSGRFFTSSTTREAHVSITFSKISEDFPLILNLEKITKEQTLTLLDPFL